MRCIWAPDHRFAHFWSIAFLRYLSVQQCKTALHIQVKNTVLQPPITKGAGWGKTLLTVHWLLLACRCGRVRFRPVQLPQDVTQRSWILISDFSIIHEYSKQKNRSSVWHGCLVPWSTTEDRLIYLELLEPHIQPANSTWGRLNPEWVLSKPVAKQQLRLSTSAIVHHHNTPRCQNTQKQTHVS